MTEAAQLQARPPAHPLWPLFVLVVGAGVLALVLAHPAADGTWENHPAHFWLVLGAAAINVALGYAVGVAAQRRRDARLLLVSLAFVSAAGFLGLHALATPGVLIGKNAGFELATPAGLSLAGLFSAASGLMLRPRAAERILALAWPLILALSAVMAFWAAVSLAELGPFRGPLGAEELDGWQISLAGVGVVLYAAAALGYYRLYRLRRARFLLGVALAFALLAEAMLVIAWARSWRVSWWEWHLLMLVAFGAIAVSARTEWHEERFSPLYLDETQAGTREVSVLFADLQGFTSFSERAAPSDVIEMLNEYWAATVPVLEAEGGLIERFAGDAVMVVFNAGADQEDHAARACRAALELQRTSGPIADGRPGWPRFRAGVNTGPAVIGNVGSAERRSFTAVGDTTNLAARLQAQAQAGQVVIGSATLAAVGDGARVAPLGALALKGKSEPVEAYVLEAFS
jgi:adenylate cyclase